MNNEPSESVLIVDDNATNLQVLAEILKSREYKIAMAKNGVKALHFIDKIKPDLILLDIMMPEMNGFEVCRKLKENHDTKEIPIIFISALSDTSDKIKGFEAGGVDYITKPFQKEEVLARVKAHMDLRNAHKKLEIINEELKKINKDMKESIQYAKMIQCSLLPNPEKIMNYLPESFFIWMPKDVVGGDIFFAEFFSDDNDKAHSDSFQCFNNTEYPLCNDFIIALIDCTGHGVPGAFMTMIASSGLKRIIIDEGYRDPANILKRLNFIVKTTLHQDTEYAKSDDGMDAAIVRVQESGVRSQEPEDKRQNSEADSRQPTTYLLTFAGAKLPLFYTQDGELFIVKGDKQNIGYKKSDLEFDFTNHVIPVRKGISFYIASDGFEDQMGKNEYSRFKFGRLGRDRFISLLKEISRLDFKHQKEMLMASFQAYKGDMEQQDDITLIGFRVLCNKNKEILL